MAQQGSFYHPDEVKWEDNVIDARQYDFQVRLHEHISEEDYKKMTPEERQRFLTDLAIKVSKTYMPFNVQLISVPNRVVSNAE